MPRLPNPLSVTVTIDQEPRFEFSPDMINTARERFAAHIVEYEPPVPAAAGEYSSRGAQRLAPPQPRWAPGPGHEKSHARPSPASPAIVLDGEVEHGVWVCAQR